MRHPYDGATAALTTKHGKAAQIAPAFAALGVRVETVELDTDQFGTFSREIPRTGSQRDTAIAKARLGMAASQLRYGIASEATIGADPLVPFLNSTVEAIAWVDDELGFELVEFHRSLEIVVVHETITTENQLVEVLTRADFPNHGLIAYQDSGEVIKGICDQASLRAALERLGGAVTIESDLRASMSPSRQVAIAECATKLVARLRQLCKECSAPGFGPIENLLGLPCESCGNEVAGALRGELLGCANCGYRQERINERRSAPARECGYCNP